jgi:hypothetical protein
VSFIDLCVVPLGAQISMVVVLKKIQPGPLVRDRVSSPVASFFWDEGQDPGPGGVKFWATPTPLPYSYKTDGYGADPWLTAGVYAGTLRMTKIAASPGGGLYLLSPSVPFDDPRSSYLYYWDHEGAHRVRDMPLLTDVTNYDGHSKTVDLGMSASRDKVYIFGPRRICYKNHGDIKNPRIPWSWISPPGTSPETTPMPDGWFYTCLNETEGGQLLATIRVPGKEWPNGSWYKWDGKWERNNSWWSDTLFGAFPLPCHARFNALKAAVEGFSLPPRYIPRPNDIPRPNVE